MKRYLKCREEVDFTQLSASEFRTSICTGNGKDVWQQVSHLLLKYIKSGYETVLTAACARQGCSVTE
jgi:hypothetical protein